MGSSNLEETSAKKGVHPIPDFTPQNMEAILPFKALLIRHCVWRLFWESFYSCKLLMSGIEAALHQIAAYVVDLCTTAKGHGQVELFAQDLQHMAHPIFAIGRQAPKHRPADQ